MEDELASALKALPQRNRTVLELRYGLGEWGQAYTETETARILKISKTRVHQLERVGLRKLSHPRFSKILEGYLPSQEWKTLEAKDKIRADPP